MNKTEWTSGLGVRSANALKNSEFKNKKAVIEALKNESGWALLTIPRLGRSSYTEILAWLGVVEGIDFPKMTARRQQKDA